MCWKFETASLVASVSTALLLTSLAAGAQTQTKKKRVADSQSEVVVASKPKTRVTVPPRSFLDAGTYVVPGERKFMDYAFPPGYDALQVLGPGRDFRRKPLNDPWDIPGSNKF
jgi:hypothetical protein